MPDKLGRIKKGEHLSPKTEFKKGQHWRQPQAFRDRAWLIDNYVNRKRSAGDIAKEFGVTDAAVAFWLRKHSIKRRTVSEARKIKHWGLSGSKNGMHERTGNLNPRWLGGVSPERQAVYSSAEWAAAAKAVWKRDRGTCQRCGSNNKKYHIHHIISFANPETRCDPENLTTLCIPCHRFVHSRKNTAREFLKKGGG